MDDDISNKKKEFTFKIDYTSTRIETLNYFLAFVKYLYTYRQKCPRGCKELGAVINLAHSRSFTRMHSRERAPTILQKRLPNNV